MSIPQNPDPAFESRILREISSNTSPDLEAIQDDPGIYGQQIQDGQDVDSDRHSVVIGSSGSTAFEDEVIERVDNDTKIRHFLAFLEGNSFSDLEIVIVKMRLGLGEFANTRHSFDSISKKFGVTSERAMQIFNSVMHSFGDSN
jgi:hypothetical protein